LGTFPSTIRYQDASIIYGKFQHGYLGTPKVVYTDGFEPTNLTAAITPATNLNEPTAVRIPQLFVQTLHNDMLARKLKYLQVLNMPLNTYGASILGNVATNAPGVESQSMDLLLSDASDEEGLEESNDEVDGEVRHAPLITASMVTGRSQSNLPQYGLLGSYEKEKMFINTNIPFSAFVCGVQGSGKSHTTACILENALIQSSQLGRLQRPLSALVFSYGQFGGDGSGFSVSEAAFLATPHPAFPNHPHVTKINVLVSPSNYFKIARLYSRIPNVNVFRFKLKPQNLDIDVMLTLMNVSESDEQPLYMAAVTQVLRQMATEGGAFDYFDFRARLSQCRFNPTQVNMLQMRLGLLESFLDLDNTCPESHFKEGEVTIMDMSCPFVDANTACILFRIGLHQYLRSGATGKIVVLDEAHKVSITMHKRDFIDCPSTCCPTLARKH
jgi:hypothetical protein